MALLVHKPHLILSRPFSTQHPKYAYAIRDLLQIPPCVHVRQGLAKFRLPSKLGVPYYGSADEKGTPRPKCRILTRVASSSLLPRHIARPAFTAPRALALYLPLPCPCCLAGWLWLWRAGTPGARPTGSDVAVAVDWQAGGHHCAEDEEPCYLPFSAREIQRVGQLQRTRRINSAHSGPGRSAVCV